MVITAANHATEHKGGKQKQISRCLDTQMARKEEPRRTEPDPSLKTFALGASISDVSGDEHCHVTANKDS